MKPVQMAIVAAVAVVFLPLMAAMAIAGAVTSSAAISPTCGGTTLVSAGEWRTPMTSAYRITSHFGPRFHPVLRVNKLHTGIDLVGQGSKTIVAAAGGTVTTSGWNNAYGNQVVIDHGGGVSTRYAHFATQPQVKVGQAVQGGTPIGTEGSTGFSTGSHLHFEVIQNGKPIDPSPWMESRGAALDGRAPVEAAPAPAPAPAAPAIGATPATFSLPAPGGERRHSLDTPAAPIPENIKQLYMAAAKAYSLPWTLLAAIGMVETRHGALTATSSAGAQGHMQFMPATFNAYGVDGNGDGVVDINNPADSIYSAANYLTASGVDHGDQGVRDALWAYNHAEWYVNDVLFYAQEYGGGSLTPGAGTCDSTEVMPAA